MVEGGSAGNVVLTVRYSVRPIEFEKGKAAIAVGKRDKLVPDARDGIHGCRSWRARRCDRTYE